ncbi:MAG: hypothetical protein OXH84_00365 [Gammaproteobacteria bacterium]|nr:hypothetical protein [Gammaproteobacteria bacterium]
MLQMLRFGIGHWEYIRRDCTTYAEFEWYIKNEWLKRCKSGSILYLSSHGSPGVFTLSVGRDVSIDQLATLLDEGGAADCLVHFGGCHTFKNEHFVKEFKKKSCAWAVSGFGEESDWSRGLALEYIFFSSLGWWDIEVGNNRHKYDDF